MTGQSPQSLWKIQATSVHRHSIATLASGRILPEPMPHCEIERNTTTAAWQTGKRRKLYSSAASGALGRWTYGGCEGLSHARPRAQTVSRDLETLLHVGIAGGASDEQLLERFMAGQGNAGHAAYGQAAFEEIVRRHGPMVLGVCHRVLADRQAAEDAFQATFLVLALKAHSVRKRKSLGAWLHGVSARVARRARVDPSAPA